MRRRPPLTNTKKSANTNGARIGIGIIVLAAITAACSLIVDKKTDQCASDGDCVALGSGTGVVCQSGVCVSSGAGTDASGLDGNASDSGDGGGGDAGCTPKPPTTQDDFLNETCTSSECVPFDNCARLNMCSAGSLPALIAPPDGGV